MATLASQIVPIEVTPGVQPSTDRTALSTPHYTFADKIRFWRGIPQKIGGWLRFYFENMASIMGIARTLYSAVIANVATTIIGTNSYLYALFGQSLTNITPLQTSTIAIANSLANDYGTLAANPITTSIGTGNITVADTNASFYQAGDVYTLSGATTTNGILNTALNAAHTIRSLGTNQVNIIVSGSASSSGNGGGASVVRATGLLSITASAHGQINGQRVKINGAAAAGGITAPQINAEFIIRNVLTNSFDVMTAGTSTSSVTAAGGGATTYQQQLSAGNVDESLGVGYGLGLYGAGLYGVSKSSISGITYPRIWFLDRFGDRIVGTPGNQEGVYVWDGDTSVAPTLLTNAPTAVNYSFVSDNILVTFGYQNVDNQIFASDQGDATIWTASSQNQVFQDVIEGAERLISSVPVLGVNLIFTSNQTYRFSYIGLPNIWEIKLLDNSNGIISPMARCSVNNIAYWMGQNNFYFWSGGNVEQIPANSQDQCTCLKYVFGNINQAQSSKSFAWYNDIYNEIWFHYPSAASDECDRIVRLSISDNVWTPDTMDRTCAEYPQAIFVNPRLIDKEGDFFIHETGNDDDLVPLTFSLISNLKSSGKTTALTSEIIPDSEQTGSIVLNVQTKNYPQSSVISFNKNYIVSATTERVITQLGSRYYQFEWSGAELDQTWIMGQWQQLPQLGAPN